MAPSPHLVPATLCFRSGASRRPYRSSEGEHLKFLRPTDVDVSLCLGRRVFRRAELRLQQPPKSILLPLPDGPTACKPHLASLERPKAETPWPLHAGTSWIGPWIGLAPTEAGRQAYSKLGANLGTRCPRRAPISRICAVGASWHGLSTTTVSVIENIVGGSGCEARGATIVFAA